MSLYGAFDQKNHFSELARPIRTSEGTISAANRKLRAQTNLGLQSAGSLAGDKAFGGAGSFAGALTPTGGLAAAGGFTASPRCWASGGLPARLSTDGTNLDIVVTELYVSEVWVPANASIVGIAIMNGTAVAGNVKVMIFDSAGVRKTITATTAASGTTAYQRVPFAAPYPILGPASYWIGVMGDNSGGDLRTHVLGNFGAGKITGLVYATESGYASITVPTTFTTGLGPIASLY